MLNKNNIKGNVGGFIVFLCFEYAVYCSFGLKLGIWTASLIFGVLLIMVGLDDE